MKKILFTLFACLLIGITVFPQSPQAIKYQAVARDNAGNLLLNQNIGIKLSVLQGSSTGSVVYAESHNQTTNQFGLMNLSLGNGIVITGNFSNIDWADYLFFLKVEMDPNGGTNYQFMGTSQLLSVPYAIHSETAANAANVVYSDTSAINEIQTLSIIGHDLSISMGNTITLPDDTSLWSANGNDIYYQNGFVGIGTDTPSEPLHVHTTSGTSYIKVTDNTDSSGIKLGLNGTGNAYILNHNSGKVLHLGADGSFDMTIDPDGFIEFNNQSRARAYLNSTYFVPPSTWIPIPFDAVSYDEHDEFGIPVTQTFTATKEGYYQVNARTGFEIQDVANTAMASIAIFVNGTMYAKGNNLCAFIAQTGPAFENNAPNVSDVVYLAAGDIVEIFVYHTVPWPIMLLLGIAETYVSIHKLS